MSRFFGQNDKRDVFCPTNLTSLSKFIVNVFNFSCIDLRIIINSKFFAFFQLRCVKMNMVNVTDNLLLFYT